MCMHDCTMMEAGLGTRFGWRLPLTANSDGFGCISSFCRSWLDWHSNVKLYSSYTCMHLPSVTHLFVPSLTPATLHHLAVSTVPSRRINPLFPSSFPLSVSMPMVPIHPIVQNSVTIQPRLLTMEAKVHAHSAHAARIKSTSQRVQSGHFQTASPAQRQNCTTRAPGFTNSLLIMICQSTPTIDLR